MNPLALGLLTAPLAAGADPEEERRRKMIAGTMDLYGITPGMPYANPQAAPPPAPVPPPQSRPQPTPQAAAPAGGLPLSLLPLAIGSSAVPPPVTAALPRPSFQAPPPWGDTSAPGGVPLSVYRRGGTVVDAMPAGSMTPDVAAQWQARAARDAMGGPIPITNWAAATGQAIGPYNQDDLARQAIGYQLAGGQQGQEAARTGALAAAQRDQGQQAGLDRASREGINAANLQAQHEQDQMRFGPKGASQRAIEAIVLNGVANNTPQEDIAKQVEQVRALWGGTTTPASGPSVAPVAKQQIGQAFGLTPGAKMGDLPMATKAPGVQEFGSALAALPEEAFTPEGAAKIAAGIRSGSYGPSAAVEDAIARQIAAGMMKSAPFGIPAQLTGPHVDVNRDTSLGGRLGTLPSFLMGAQPFNTISVKGPNGSREIPVGDAVGNIWGNLFTSDATREQYTERRRRAEIIKSALDSLK